MTRRLNVGLSTCPNDTFAFHALLEGCISTPGLDLRFELLDIEELNRGLRSGRFDAAKVSAHAALDQSALVWALPVGWALGHGVGPVVLAPATEPEAQSVRPRVLTPGPWTTATLLWKLFHSEPVELEHTVFSAILPALEAARAHLGVCIHEARFTWRERGLRFVEDLGERWAQRTDAPLPLGGLVARRALGEHDARALTDAVGRSIDWARAHPDACLTSMRRYAQEEADEVLWKHVELYVTERTRELGADGRRSLAMLSQLGREAGLLDLQTPELVLL